MITVTDESGNKYYADPEKLTIVPTQDAWTRLLPDNTPVQAEVAKYPLTGPRIYYARKDGVVEYATDEDDEIAYKWAELFRIQPVPPPDNYAWARSQGYRWQTRWASGIIYYLRQPSTLTVGESDGSDTVIYVGPIPEE